MQKLWTWDKEDGIVNDEDAYLGIENCIDFDKELCFNLGKSTRKKHQSVLQDNV